MRSVVVVLPASMWAMIPMLRVRSRGYSLAMILTVDNGRRPYSIRPSCVFLLVYEWLPLASSLHRATLPPGIRPLASPCGHGQLAATSASPGLRAARAECRPAPDRSRRRHVVA